MKLFGEVIQRIVGLVLGGAVLWYFAPDIAGWVGMSQSAARSLVIVSVILAFLLFVVYPLRFVKR